MYEIEKNEFCEFLMTFLFHFHRRVKVDPGALTEKTDAQVDLQCKDPSLRGGNPEKRIMGIPGRKSPNRKEIGEITTVPHRRGENLADQQRDRTRRGAGGVIETVIEKQIEIEIGSRGVVEIGVKIEIETVIENQREIEIGNRGVVEIGVEIEIETDVEKVTETDTGIRGDSHVLIVLE